MRFMISAKTMRASHGSAIATSPIEKKYRLPYIRQAAWKDQNTNAELGEHTVVLLCLI
jgi:hypothetical protein